MNRPDKHTYYLNVAKEVAKRSTCLRRNFGAVIVNTDEIVSTGYNGSPRGMHNCSDLGYCKRDTISLDRGTNYDIPGCSVHAEQNAIISAARKHMIGATLYLYGHDARTNTPVQNAWPCVICTRMLINAGIARIVVNTEAGYSEKLVEDIIVNDTRDIYRDTSK